MGEDRVSRKKTFTAYGNCQAHALAEILMTNADFSRKFEYIPIPPIFSMETSYFDVLYEDVLPSMDVLIYMPVGGLYRDDERFSSQSILKAVSASADLLSFTTCYFRGYNPELMYVDKVPALETGRFTDLNLLGAYLAGERDPVRCARLIEQDDLLDPAFLQSIVDGSIAGLAQREKHGDSRGAMSLGCADYIAEHFRSRQLFFTLNHPAREILCHLADRRWV